MKAFKCDRCEKLYELTPAQSRLRHYQTSDYNIVIGELPGRLDLCDKCFNELQEWVTVYMTDKTEEE